MAEESGGEGARGMTPPYAPFPSLKTFLRNAKQQGLANRIDRSVLTNFAGGTQTQLMTTFRFLGLIDGAGHPTGRMAMLVSASETDEWPGVLEALLRETYAPLFQNLATTSPNEFNERFRGAFQGADSVQRKAVSFFLNAAQDAKIPVSRHMVMNKKPRSGTGNPKPPNAYELLAVLDMSDMNDAEQSAVFTLIRYLKKKEAGVPASRRAAFAKVRASGGADANIDDPPPAPSG